MKKKFLAGLAAVGCLLAASAAQAEGRGLEPTVSLAFVGDIMLDERPGQVARRGEDPFRHFARLLASTDIRVGNLECVLAIGGTAEPGKPYTFRAHPRTLKFLKRHFDALGLANNHSGDFGPEAFGEMLGHLERHGLPYFGGGRNLAHAHQPLLIERHGLRIALLGYNEFLPRSFEADYDKPGVAWSEDEQVTLDIRSARARLQADLVIAVMHWGWENEPLADARQRHLARLMIDAGADAVIGGHPHVVQDIEHYRNRPIFYSLGNFVFDGFSTRENNTGWMVRMEFDRQGVRHWQTTVAHIDREGLPHPASKSSELCWRRGDRMATPCSRDFPAFTRAQPQLPRVKR